MTDDQPLAAMFKNMMPALEMMERLEMEIITEVVALTSDNLPEMPLWEDDGCCWKAEKLAVSMMEPAGWRWKLMNWPAFAKGFPTGEMHKFMLPPLSPSPTTANDEPR